MKGRIAEKVRAAIALGRPVNALMVFIAAAVGGLLAGLSVEEALLPALSAALISMGAQAINDYFDVELDKKKPHRKPLVEGALTLREGRMIALLYFTVGSLLGLFASPLHFAVAVLASVLSYLYSARWQRKKYYGNVVVSLLVALSIIYGGLSGAWEKTLLPALIVFLVNWGREILKDVDDRDVDYPKKISLVHVVGRQWANFLGSYLVFLGVVFSPFPYLMSELSGSFLPLMLLADLVALWAVAEALRYREGRAEKMLKVAMGMALLAFVAGVVT